MNILGLVFAILAILSFSAFACFEKQVGAHRIRSSFAGHKSANRKILEQLTSEYYAALKSIPAPTTERAHKKNEEPPQPEEPHLNPPCAKFNLSPLVENPASEAMPLYRAIAKLLKTFYGKELFENKPKAENRFLDQLISAVRQRLMQEGPFALEKLVFADPNYQALYYKMLKGTKYPDGYPSLLDYLKVEQKPTLICIAHAHPNLLAALFSPETAPKLYAAIHAPKAPPLSKETIEQICLSAHHKLIEGEVFELLSLTDRHPETRSSTRIGTDPDTQISLRKNLSH